MVAQQEQITNYCASSEVVAAVEGVRVAPESVLKFGGSSLATIEGLKNAVGLIGAEYQQNGPCVVVVSAMGKMTDFLYKLCDARAQNKSNRVGEMFTSLAEGHRSLVRRMDLSEDRSLLLRVNIHKLIDDMKARIYHARVSRGSMTKEDEDWIVSYGERLSSQIVTAFCQEGEIPAVAVDASRLIITDYQFGAANPDLQRTRRQINAVLQPFMQRGRVVVVPGFFGATPDGKLAILGRNCSDFSAAIIALCVSASMLQLYKDVNGVYDSDPKTNPRACVIEHLTPEQYASIDGADKIIQPKVIDVLSGNGITLHVRNTYSPESKGTKMVL